MSKRHNIEHQSAVIKRAIQAIRNRIIMECLTIHTPKQTAWLCGVSQNMVYHVRAQYKRQV